MIPQTVTTTQPSSVSQSQIEELSKKVQSLRARTDLANGAYIVFLILTVLSTMLLARWTGKASRAQDELMQAKDRKLTSDLKEKDGQIAKTNERAAKLEQEAAQARIRQAEAERTLLEIQERFTSRTLTSEQRNLFVKQLEDVPKGRVEVWVVQGNAEAFTFASQIWNALKEAGFDTGPGPSPNIFNLFGPPPIGVAIEIKDKDKVPPSAGPIQEALKRVGIEARGEVSGFCRDVNVVDIRVGEKPVP